MPAIFVALAALLLRLVEPIVTRVLLALGISFVTIQGFDIVLDSWATEIFSGLGELGGSVGGVLGVLRVADAINVVVSATIAAYSIRAMTIGLRRMVMQ